MGGGVGRGRGFGGGSGGSGGGGKDGGATHDAVLGDEHGGGDEGEGEEACAHHWRLCSSRKKIGEGELSNFWMNLMICCVVLLPARSSALTSKCLSLILTTFF